MSVTLRVSVSFIETSITSSPYVSSTSPFSFKAQWGRWGRKDACSSHQGCVFDFVRHCWRRQSHWWSGEGGGGRGWPPVQTDHILVEVGGRCRRVTDADSHRQNWSRTHLPTSCFLTPLHWSLRSDQIQIHLPWIWMQNGVNPHELAVIQMCREDPISSLCQYRHRPLFQQHSLELSFPGRKKKSWLSVCFAFPLFLKVPGKCN